MKIHTGRERMKHYEEGKAETDPFIRFNLFGGIDNLQASS
jgi:hypothetical protein